MNRSETEAVLAVCRAFRCQNVPLQCAHEFIVARLRPTDPKLADKLARLPAHQVERLIAVAGQAMVDERATNRASP